MLPALVTCSVDPELMVLPVSEVPHAASWHELEEVFGGTAKRRAMIMTARARLELIASHMIPIAAVWVNGSFVTSTPEPSDIDVAWLVNGATVSSMWVNGDMEAGEAAELVQRYMDERYEPGGSPNDHLTDFRGLYWHPEGHGFYHHSMSYLDYWSTVWSRVKVKTGGHTEGDAESTLYDNGKGFVEVRWSS